jgi:hypothetical protein
MGGTLVLVAVACVTASSLAAHTPLYTVRMEQVSSEMHFLPTVMNAFTYTAESGYTLGFNVSGGGGAVVRGTDATCHPSCSTCPITCEQTCPNTCIPTCPYTCDDPTCPYTCPQTCDDPTCPYTCEGPTCSGPTCYVSCGGTCDYTCEGYHTCEYHTCEPMCEP